MRGSSGGGVSTICGTDFRSTGVFDLGGDCGADECLCISGMLDVLDRLEGSSSLKIESKVEGTDEPKPALGETSRPAGREKFIAALLAGAADTEGSLSVRARFATSPEAKIGIGGIAGTLASGDSGLLPDGLPLAALLAALCA